MVDSIRLQAAQGVHEYWQVDGNRCVWHEDGFDWWPGDYKQSIKVGKPQKRAGLMNYPLTARTDFLTDLADLDHKGVRTLFDTLGRAVPSYALQVLPGDLPGNWSICLVSRVYVNEDNIDWMLRFFCRMAIVQTIIAQIKAEKLAEACNAKPDVSSLKNGTNVCHDDDMLHLVRQLYMPAGRNPSRWDGSDEFKQIAERYGNSDLCFGIEDSKGVTLETPCGEDSILIRMLVEQAHPQLGNGLTVHLQLPRCHHVSGSRKTAFALNFNEYTSFTLLPLLGCWHAREAAHDSIGPAFSMFVPNVLYRPGIATNMAVWMLARARWAKDYLWPDLPDLNIGEIVQSRLEARS